MLINDQTYFKNLAGVHGFLQKNPNKNQRL